MLLDKLYCTVKRCRWLNLCMRWSPFYDITVMKWIGILSIIICCLRVWRDLGLILESLKSVVKIDFSVFAGCYYYLHVAKPGLDVPLATQKEQPDYVSLSVIFV